MMNRKAGGAAAVGKPTVGREMTDPISLLFELYYRVHDRPLGDSILETVAAAQEHWEITARVGVNQDGTISVFCRDDKKAKLIGEAIRNAKAVHVMRIPDVSMQDVRRLMRQQGVVAAFGPRGNEQDEQEQVVGGWPRLLAVAYLRSLPDITEAVESDPRCCDSEARFRDVLHTKLGWGVTELDAAVAWVRSGFAIPPPDAAVNDGDGGLSSLSDLPLSGGQPHNPNRDPSQS